MKRVLFFLILSASSLPVVLSAQEIGKLSWRKSDNHWTRKNSITFTASAFGFSNYDTFGLAQLNLEYDRTLPYNLSVSAMGMYAPLTVGALDAYAPEEKFWFAGAKVNYNLPVVRNWLYLRIGVGAGVGWHNIVGRSSGWFEEGMEPDPDLALKDRVKPHFIVDAYWIFRATRWLELRFAPGIVSPSQFIVGSRFEDDDDVFLYYNAMGTLGVTVRF